MSHQTSRWLTEERGNYIDQSNCLSSIVVSPLSPNSAAAFWNDHPEFEGTDEISVEIADHLNARDCTLGGRKGQRFTVSSAEDVARIGEDETASSENFITRFTSENSGHEKILQTFRVNSVPSNARDGPLGTNNSVQDDSQCARMSCFPRKSDIALTSVARIACSDHFASSEQILQHDKTFASDTVLLGVPQENVLNNDTAKSGDRDLNIEESGRTSAARISPTLMNCTTDIDDALDGPDTCQSCILSPSECQVASIKAEPIYQDDNSHSCNPLLGLSTVSEANNFDESLEYGNVGKRFTKKRKLAVPRPSAVAVSARVQSNEKPFSCAHCGKSIRSQVSSGCTRAHSHRREALQL
jgi:hypothetical protein